MDYYSSLIYSAESDSKTLFRTITRLLHRKADKLFPTSSSAVDLANEFVHFFEGKIVNIRSNLVTPVIPNFFRTLDTSSLTRQLVNFAPISSTELSNIANNIIMKSCILIWILFPPPYCSSNSSYFYQLSYSQDLSTRYLHSRSLRSSSTLSLNPVSFNVKTYGSRAFSVSVPELWNKLPDNIRSCENLSLF